MMSRRDSSKAVTVIFTGPEEIEACTDGAPAIVARGEMKGRSRVAKNGKLKVAASTFPKSTASAAACDYPAIA
jgi:hypothetical protein